MTTHLLKGTLQDEQLVSFIPEIIMSYNNYKPIKFQMHTENQEFIIQLSTEDNGEVFGGLIELIENYLEKVRVSHFVTNLCQTENPMIH